MRVVVPILCSLLICCLSSSILPAQSFHLLVFSKTEGFRHASIEPGIEALKGLAKEHGFTLDATEDAAVFTDDGLAGYDAIVFLNTTQDILDEDQQKAMEAFIRGGKGFVGIHSATDTEYDWPWYGGLVGAYFESHPRTQEATLDVLDQSHGSTKMLPRTWTRTDEWYNFKQMNPDVHVLITVDEDSYEGGTNGPGHPFAWYHTYDGGRAWYTLGGHTKESFSEDLFLQHVLGGIRYAANREMHNTLTAAEKAAGWQLLFDGKTTEGWRTYKKDKPGSSWVVQDGTLTLEVEPTANGRTKAKDGGTLMTIDQYENYELSLEWKVAPCGNSGIIYNIHEAPEYKRAYMTGPEMQVLDDACHPDAKIRTHRAGDLYDMIECSVETVRPAGQWNQVLLRINNGQTEFHLNGTKVVEFEMYGDDWAEMIQESKFKSMPGFGKYRKGHIGLQDHGDKISYRNIKLRALQ